MAIQTAGQKPAKATKLKIENQATFDLPKDTNEQIYKVLDYLPLEHQRGLEKVKLVDFINNPQLLKMDVPIKGDLPGMYYPKVGGKNAYLELSMGALLQPTEGFAKRWMAKQSFKSNLAGLIFSLIGQHYYLTLRHWSVRKISNRKSVNMLRKICANGAKNKMPIHFAPNFSNRLDHILNAGQNGLTKKRLKHKRKVKQCGKSWKVFSFPDFPHCLTFQTYYELLVSKARTRKLLV
jgi:hypothetical protein